MAEITCRVIPEPKLNDGRVILKQEPTKKSPYFDGSGPDSYHCGNCNFVLAKKCRQRLDTKQNSHRRRIRIGLSMSRMQFI